MLWTASIGSLHRSTLPVAVYAFLFIFRSFSKSVFLLLELFSSSRAFSLPSSSAIFYSLNLSMLENLHIVSYSQQALSLKYVAPACVCS